MSATKYTLSKVDTLTEKSLSLFAVFSASMIILISFFITVRGIMPFITDNNGLRRVNILRFLTSNVWLAGETFVSTAYGAGFLVIQTLYIAFLALLVAFPIGVLTALFIAKIAPTSIANILRTIIELLTSVPSIVFGLVGAGLILPYVYQAARAFGFQSSGGSGTLSVVIVLALMSIPTITAISEVAIRSVDESLEQAALALGATNTQTRFSVTLLAAKNGLFSSTILAIGRALGEATAVSLVAGNARSGPNFGLFDITSTITSTMLQGMKETSGVDYDIRFSLGILLMVVILLTNLSLNFVKKKVGNIHE